MSNLSEEEKAIEIIRKEITKPKTTPLEVYITDIKMLLNIINKQQKELEELKANSIGDTKFEKLLFSIRMLHFHNYITDKQFYEMIKKLSNIGE